MVENREPNRQTGKDTVILKNIQKTFEGNKCVTASPWLDESNFSAYQALIFKNKQNGKLFLAILSGEISEHKVTFSDYSLPGKDTHVARLMTFKKNLNEDNLYSVFESFTYTRNSTIIEGNILKQITPLLDEAQAKFLDEIQNSSVDTETTDQLRKRPPTPHISKQNTN